MHTDPAVSFEEAKTDFDGKYKTFIKKNSLKVLKRNIGKNFCCGLKA